MDPLTVSHLVADGRAIIRCAGNLDHVTSPRLRIAVEEVLGHDPRSLLIDGRGLQRIDAAGARALSFSIRMASERKVTVSLDLSRDGAAAFARFRDLDRASEPPIDV